MSSRFLTAAWRNLAMLNYAIEPQVLAPLVPAGCELDTFAGKTFVSVVGFQFLNTRVLGLPIPFHIDFDEVNLRFYVRRKAEGEWRRGVAFVKEIVPRRGIAFLARALYGENYVALPMRHTLASGLAGALTRLQYEWCRAGAWEGLALAVEGGGSVPADDSEEAFITEHYWGYAKQPGGATVEYRVEHPRWSVWRATKSSLACDVAALYGSSFAEALSGSPSSAFLADGSDIVVHRGHRVA